MKICEHSLKGTNQSEISTELKFLLASARYDGVELLRFSYDVGDVEKETKRIYNVILRVLRSVRAKGLIEFFVLPEDFGEEKTEAMFLLNKYAAHFAEKKGENTDIGYFYIKV